MEKLILYSNNCPKCKILKEKLDESSIDYEISNDFSNLIDNGFKTLPILKTNKGFLKFLPSINYIKEISV